jgi:hypothetical protein
MADIRTEKQLVAVLNDPHKSHVNLAVNSDVVVFSAKNEGVIHHCLFTPEEAVKIGVSLIQLAHQARAMGEEQRAAHKLNGNPLVKQ